MFHSRWCCSWRDGMSEGRVHRYTARGFPRHQGGEGVAGTPGACSQVFCHPIKCMFMRSYRQRHDRYTIVRTTTTTTTTRLRRVCEHFVVRCDFMAESGCRPRMVDGDGAAKRRRQRRLRSWLRHEQQTVAAVLATVSHHSYPALRTAPREGVEHEKYGGPRAPRRPGLPPEAGGKGSHGRVRGCPGAAAGRALLASAAGEAVDHSTLQFLLTRAIETKKALEEEERQKRVLESVVVHAGEPLSAAEHEAWYGTSSSSTRKRRKKKKRRRRKLPKAPLPRCGRPCAFQRQVPAVLRVLRASGSVPRQDGGHSVVQQRQVPTVFFTVLVQFLGKVVVPVLRNDRDWSDSAEDRAGAAGAVNRRSSTSLSCRRGKSPRSCLFGSCLPCPLLRTTGAQGSDSAQIRGGAAVAVPPMVMDVAVTRSDKFPAVREVRWE